MPVTNNDVSQSTVSNIDLYMYTLDAGPPIHVV